MSKLMEALRASTRETAKQENGKMPRKKTDHELTQEQLAEVYFASQDKRRKSDAPIVLRVVERPGAASLIPWIITSVAFLITAFSLFSTKRIFVDVHVVDEKHPFFRAAEMDRALENYEGFQPAGPAESLEGQRLSMQGAVFEGAAKLSSTSDRTSLVLVNSSVAPFARASLAQEVPLDLTHAKIVFLAKGNEGGENLAFALRDKNNVQAFGKGKIYPFPDGLTTEWRRAEVPMKDVVSGFNLRDVTGLRFEFGSNVRNKPGSTVFVKDLQVVS
ncbi:MAG TPA: hypothetical protein VL404_08980 [Candidatus Eisenbacteria bacterium]|jgi:hypothetical protein|nr:hypothetical protein [Candidatus Eisenbacteria bacterium]